MFTMAILFEEIKNRISFKLSGKYMFVTNGDIHVGVNFNFVAKHVHFSNSKNAF